MNVVPESHKLEWIFQSVAPQGQLLRTWPLPGGMSAEMNALEITLPDGRIQKLVVRRYSEDHLKNKPNAAATEFRLLQLTHTTGLPTPRPYYLDASGQYLVMEFMAGEMLFAPTNVTHHVTQLATQLARIHRLTAIDFDLSFLGEPVTTCAEMAQPAEGELFDEAEVRAALTTRPLVNSSTHPLTLLHGDFWPGNSLWQDGELVAVIDWEDALWGDPLIDLARGRAEIAWIFGIEAMQQFTARYQTLMPFDYTYLPYWDLCAALRFIRLFGTDLVGAAAYFAPFGRADITALTIQNNMQSFVHKALDDLL